MQDGKTIRIWFIRYKVEQCFIIHIHYNSSIKDGRFKVKETKSLTVKEIKKASNQFRGEFETRDSCLFMLALSTGGHLSELLALTIGDVYKGGRPVDDLQFTKDIVKGGNLPRAVPVNGNGTKAIQSLVNWHINRYGNADTQRPLFPSRNNGGKVAMTPKRGQKVIKDAFIAAGVKGQLETHSLRKSYARRTYDATGDLAIVNKTLGHQDIKKTEAYIRVNDERGRRAMEAIEINRSKKDILLSSLSKKSLKELLIILFKWAPPVIGVILHLIG